MSRVRASDDPRVRLAPLLGAARRIADPNDPLGRDARRALLESSGLSRETLEFCLTHCLEVDPSEAELDALIAQAAPSARSHVLLASNVFSAAHRAIALALASSAEVAVRASRREPSMAEFLLLGAPGAFQRVEQLEVLPGDQLFAYGGHAVLDELGRSLVQGVMLHAHGPGFGVAVLANAEAGAAADDARALALDVALFDQRGCLSPRLVLVPGEPSQARAWARLLARALAELEARLPLGRLSAEQAAEVRRFRDTAAYAAELVPAGSAAVSVGDLQNLQLSPGARHVHVAACADVVSALAPFGEQLTAIGCAARGELRAALARAFPAARISALGAMQMPAFDGPVDRRTRPVVL